MLDDHNHNLRTIFLEIPSFYTPMSARQIEEDDDHDARSISSPRFLVSLGDTENLEKYILGGFHPAHLGDVYDERYRIVHKLGAGGFSTIWLARDETENKWAALKIVVAKFSTSVRVKHHLLNYTVASRSATHQACVFEEYRQFTLEGPNDRHLCLVLPVLGPSTSQLSSGFDSRISTLLSRSESYQATMALADLHAHGLFHGDRQARIRVIYLSLHLLTPHVQM